MTTIICKNPACGEEIMVLPGSLQVLCYNCNTWQSPAEASSGVGAAPPPPPLPDQPAAPLPPAAVPTPTPPPTPNFAPAPNFTPLPPTTPEPQRPLRQERPPEARPIMILTSSEGQRFQLREGKNTIGREAADILLNDRTVSRFHCIIEVSARPDGGGWLYHIYDASFTGRPESGNGVLLSDRSLRLASDEKISLYDGIGITLGRIQLTLQAPPQAPPF